MAEREEVGTLLARCVVCRGNIFEGEWYEMWEGAFYCQRHSLPYLKERAREYRARMTEGVVRSEGR